VPAQLTLEQLQEVEPVSTYLSGIGNVVPYEVDPTLATSSSKATGGGSPEDEKKV
jgi:hypothetical protein